VRVVFFTHTFFPDYIAGAELSLYHTCRGLQARGYDCMVLTLNSRGKGRADQWFEVDGIPIHRITFATKKRRPLTDLLDARIFPQVRRDLRRLQPNIFHLHNVAQATLAPFVAARSTSTPTVCTLHDHWLLCPNNMLYRDDGTTCDPAEHPNGCGKCWRRYEYWAAISKRRQWMAELTNHVARFVSPSQALIDLHVAGGFDPKRFAHIPNALAAPDWVEPQNEQIIEACLAAKTQPTLVFAGGGVRNKGAEVILRALPGLLEAIPNLQFVIAGPGEAEYFREYARYAPSVRVLGKVPFSEMRALFAAADLSLSASVWPENSPMVIYENYQVGTPMLGSAIGGIPEMIDEGKTGYLFAPDDHEQMIAKVVHHFQRPTHERRQMRQACVVAAQTRWTLARHLDLTEALYAEVLDKKTMGMGVGSETLEPTDLHTKALA
jgi:glycosyltransferase involved in cell wall biosynthesis